MFDKFKMTLLVVWTALVIMGTLRIANNDQLKTDNAALKYQIVEISNDKQALASYSQAQDKKLSDALKNANKASCKNKAEMIKQAQYVRQQIINMIEGK